MRANYGGFDASMETLHRFILRRIEEIEAREARQVVT